MTDKQRPCKCLDCGHVWRWPVEYSATTQNLSGEKNIYCPECGGRQVMAGPVEPVHTFEAAHGDIEGGRVVLKKVKHINQAAMTADCFMIQIWGIEYCERCEFLNTKECGGVRIREAIQAGRYPAGGLPDMGG